jgi:hypothetical protein
VKPKVNVRVTFSSTQYKKLTDELYDDSPWTREEIQSVAWQTTERSDWPDGADNAPETR